MKHLLRPIGHCLTTAVVTSAIFEAFTLPALPTSDASSSSQSADANDLDDQATTASASSEPAPAAVAPPETTSPVSVSTESVSTSAASLAGSLTVSASDKPQPKTTQPSSAVTPSSEASAAALSILAPLTEPSSAPAETTNPSEATVEPSTATSPSPTSSPGSETAVETPAPDVLTPNVIPQPAEPAATVTPSPAAPTTPAANGAIGDEESLAAARQVLENELASLVERDRPVREEQLRRNLVVSAILYAQLSQFDLARQTAQHPALPPEMQADTLAKIDKIEAKQQQTLPEATPALDPTQAEAIALNPTQPIVIARQWTASRTPSFVNPVLSDRCLPRVLVNRSSSEEAIAKPAMAQATTEPIDISKQFSALLTNATPADGAPTLAQTVSLTQATSEDSLALAFDAEAAPALPSDLKSDFKSEALNAEANPGANLEANPEANPAAATTPVDFKLDRAVGSTLNKSLDKIGVASSVGVPTVMQSAFGWWSYLAKGEKVTEGLQDVSAEAIAAEALATPSEAVALDETVLTDDSLVTALEQHLPKSASKLGESVKAQPAAMTESADDKAASANCGGVQPIYYNRAFSINTAALQNLRWGRIGFPLSIPASITSAFGWRIHPISGDRRFHAGIDIGAPSGTPVVAAMSGRVVAADYMGGYGLAVIVENTETAQRNLYAHLSGIAVQPGMAVEQGNVLGFVGSTGNSTGPHLHFETQALTTNGWVAIDPLSVASGVTVSQGQ